MASYSSVGTFREDMQTLLYNARVTGGRGTQLWDDLNVLELRSCSRASEGKLVQYPKGSALFDCQCL
jgi:hypothetical protein